MEGDGLLHPHGPLPPGVYWRRRLIVLGAMIVVIVFLAAQFAPGKGNSKKKPPAKKPSASNSVSSTGKAPVSSSPKPTTSTSATPTASTSSSKPSTPPATAATPCQGPALQVSVKTDAAAYAAGVNPVLTMTIKNAGTTPCTRDLGAAATELTITSGTDRIWSSDDCSKGGAAKLTVLKANESKTVTLTWNRKRSKPVAACVGADALSGRYRVVGRLGDVSTLPGTFGLS